MAIRTYKVVHTGAKSQDGGLNDGLMRVLYQVAISGRVNNDATNPIVNVINKLIKKGRNSNLCLTVCVFMVLLVLRLTVFTSICFKFYPCENNLLKLNF